MSIDRPPIPAHQKDRLLVRRLMSFSVGKVDDTNQCNSRDAHGLFILCAVYRSPSFHIVQAPTPVLRRTSQGFASTSAPSWPFVQSRRVVPLGSRRSSPPAASLFEVSPEHR